MKRQTLLGLMILCFFCGKAQSHYPGQHKGKFAIADQLKPAVYAFDLQDVRLLDSRFKENMEREQKWLQSIEPYRLLHSFRTNAGVYAGNEGGYHVVNKLGGWESLDCEVRGHSAGHILSGLALMYASTGDGQYKIKGDSLVRGLSEVQIALNQDGYLSAFPQELINRNMRGQRVWAPWYTLHKILSGLIDQYLYCENKQALDVASRMGSWAYQKLKPVTPKQRTIMLRNEFGGINESFYNLYAITGNKEYQWLAEFFYHNEMLDPLKEEKDILEKKHANTYIPKLLGLTRDYELEGKGDGHKVADFFWQTVIDHHSFATGSNSDQEKFFKPDHQSEHLTGYTGESCNVYNMLKLTRHLFTHTAESKYADYYEKALYNHILGQQDPATGMIAYFLPMLPGAHKVYSTPEHSFWCCVGSGFENQAKYGEAIYYHDQDGLYVNLFIPSELTWKEKGMKVRLESSFPEEGTTLLTIEAAPGVPAALHIRYPSWAVAGASVTVNGKKIPVKGKPGSYISINRKWNKGDRVAVHFPMTLRSIPANDNPGTVAFAYGPIVLAGVMGTEGMTIPAPYSNPELYNDYYTYNYNVPQGISNVLDIDVEKPDASIKPVAGEKLTFKTAKEGVLLKPLYDIHRERYVVYWNINPGSSKDKVKHQ
ncbi:glycoside hydrolase family 127 protein [Chitinophagaceae bacterium LB-8]|uniref:Glycoside hydrolase family 127 protein n=1 Tax=Paraflavisolibacter caeni TaxID=2982496 RepID=A0A9X2XUR2_9BACT|nr:glycoside hydrolase family 127 protein [Paraflavisolibacter caeni]MCU7549446.1 glycoside hydrolase family 127 protein [Paraflavisolibacter caeni]